MKVDLHTDRGDLNRSFFTALILPATLDDGSRNCAPDVLIYGDRCFKLDADHTRRLRRPTYVPATWHVTGPMRRKIEAAGILVPAGTGMP